MGGIGGIVNCYAIPEYGQPLQYVMRKTIFEYTLMFPFVMPIAHKNHLQMLLFEQLSFENYSKLNREYELQLVENHDMNDAGRSQISPRFNEFQRQLIYHTDLAIIIMVEKQTLINS
ncbi:CLUMA_CG003086, isoform A [Clunio marinus]|uniref:CLUMA_CG003086, isoform A n=1 Tax=Clunio marinus TaxID=568069 RepID=A0A1J1HMP7_9DIPT|nr:CLUMA_CG003086, isoform A [Clunio marinus]